MSEKGLSRGGEVDETSRHSADDGGRSSAPPPFRGLPRGGSLSRSNSPASGGVPLSLRQQLARIKQMEQPSPSGSIDGDASSTVSGGGGSGHNANTPQADMKKRIAKVHKKNTRGETPLHVAARRGDNPLCAQLIADGAEVNTPDYAGWTPLHEACSHGKFETAHLLIRHGAHVNHSSNEEQVTPLHDAAHTADKRIVWLLLKFGADRESTDSEGKRPIDLCDQESEAYRLLISPVLPVECPPETPDQSPDREEEEEEEMEQKPTPSMDPHSLPAPSTSASSSSITLPTRSNIPIAVVHPISIEVESPEASLGFMTAPATAETSPVPQPAGDNVPKEEVDEDEMVDERVDEDEREEDEEEEMEEEEDVRSGAGVKSVDSQKTEAAMEDIEEEDDNDNEGDEVAPAKQVTVKEEERTETADPALEDDLFDEVENTLKIEEYDEDDEDVEPQEDKKEDGPSPSIRRSAVWKQSRGDISRTESPDAYDFVDEDRCQSEDSEMRRGQRGRGSGRGGRGGRSTVSIPRDKETSEKKRGRGRKRGRLPVGRGGSGASTPRRHDDPYEFKDSPDSEGVGQMDPPSREVSVPAGTRESSAPPSWKRMRLNQEEAGRDGEEREDSNEGAEGGDVDMDDLDEDEAARGARQRGKVPPLRISLKTPSEEDGADDGQSMAGSMAPSMSSRGGKSAFRGGRPPGSGKRGNGDDETSRVTRSRVRQSGRTVEEPDYYAKKKGKKALADNSSTAVSPEPDVKEEVCSSVSSAPYCLQEIVDAEPNPALKVMLFNCRRGFVNLRKQIESRWLADMTVDVNTTASMPDNVNEYMSKTGKHEIQNQEDLEDVKFCRPPSFLPVTMHRLWLTQERERDSLRIEMNTACARLRTTAEREYIRLHRKERGEVPRMSICRMLQESEVYNSMALLDPGPPMEPQPVDKGSFVTKASETVDILYKDQRHQTEALQARQKLRFEYESRGLGSVFSEWQMQKIVPLLEPRKVDLVL